MFVSDCWQRTHIACVCLRVCLAAVGAYLGPPSAMGQLHTAQRDPLLWCEWKEPCCCWLMLFLATSPFQRRLYCWGTAGGLPVCLSKPPPRPPTPLIHHTACSSQPHCHAAQLSNRKWGKKGLNVGASCDANMLSSLPMRGQCAPTHTRTHTLKRIHASAAQASTDNGSDTINLEFFPFCINVV